MHSKQPCTLQSYRVGGWGTLSPWRLPIRDFPLAYDIYMILTRILALWNVRGVCEFRTRIIYGRDVYSSGVLDRGSRFLIEIFAKVCIHTGNELCKKKKTPVRSDSRTGSLNIIAVQECNINISYWYYTSIWVERTEK